VVFVLTALINMRGVLAAMKKKSNLTGLVLLAATVLTVNPAPSQVTLGPLTANQITNQMFGRMFTGEYPSGAGWSEHFKSNLTSTYSESGAKLDGVMRFEGDALCFSYPQSNKWFGGCFQVWKRGNNCFDFYSVQSNVSLFDRRFGRAWQARAWRTDAVATCFSAKVG